jgi:hypothetical protein
LIDNNSKLGLFFQLYAKTGRPVDLLCFPLYIIGRGGAVNVTGRGDIFIMNLMHLLFFAGISALIIY